MASSKIFLHVLRKCHFDFSKEKRIEYPWKNGEVYPDRRCGRLQPLFPKTVLVWRIRLVCATAAGLFLCGALAAFSLVLSAAAGAILLGIFLISCLWYCPRRYQSCSWRLTEDNVQICKGVFFRVQRILPLSQIQYTELLRTPAQRLCGASSLIFHAAGVKLSIDGLSLGQGRYLWKQVNQGRELP